MESSRQSSLAQLSSWTESMKKKAAQDHQKTGSSASAKKSIADDDYEEEFEDYDEDFEAEEESPKPQPKSVAPFASSAKQTAAPPRTEITEKVTESKVSENLRVVNESQPKTFERMSFQMSSLSNPRIIRAQKLKNSGIMDMQYEKATHLNIIPTSPYDFYLNSLRSPSTSLKQVGVPVDQEIRDMEINTDEILTSSKEIQVSYGDDTEFFNMMSKIGRKNRLRSAGSEGKISENENEKQEVYVKSTQSQTDLGASEDTDGSASRFAAFLHRSSALMENLLVENLNVKREEAKTSSSSQLSILDADQPWQKLGTDKTNGINELICTRLVSSLKFSELQPNLLLTVHPYPVGEDEEADLKPYKGLYSVWDTAKPGGPLYILEGSGQATCACFSGVQSYLVVGGTLEGSIHLWDLRENASVHKDKDSLDLKIGKGIRKPSFSTHFSNLNSEFNDDEQNHSSPIVQIESLDSPADIATASSNSVVSQFASIDEACVVIFWVTSQSSSAANLDNDFGRSPWASISLIQTRKIVADLSGSLQNLGLHGADSQATGKENKKSKNQTNLEDKLNSSKPGRSVNIILSTIPEDTSELLVAGTDGKVTKISRFGEPTAPHIFDRIEKKSLEITSSTENSKNKGASTNSKSQLKYSSPITAICLNQGQKQLHNSSTNSGNNSENYKNDAGLPALMLVGRADGTVDLFRLDSEIPLQSWNLSGFSDGSGSAYNSSITMLKWCPSRASVFFAGDEGGNLYLFDLLKEPFKPLCVENVRLQSRLTCRLIDLSRIRAGGNYINVALTEMVGGKSSSIKIRRISRGILSSFNVSRSRAVDGHVDGSLLHEENALFTQALNKWSSISSYTNITAAIVDQSSNHK